ncbi:protein capicua homolog isoform X2 [Dermacentor albipictus]|uniref:protein capicua homolog isoform X2 n=1 Tax=Dermacentor albipictus TaxID=60249 RepID=UPI0038FC2B57
MFNVEQQQFGSLLSHSHYQNNIVSAAAAAARQPCSSSMVAMGRRGSAGDSASPDPMAGVGGASTSSGDETSTDCKDSAYVSSEGLMGTLSSLLPVPPYTVSPPSYSAAKEATDTSPPVTSAWPQFPAGTEGVFDRLHELAIIATSPESPLLRDSPPLVYPASSSSSSSTAGENHHFQPPPLSPPGRQRSFSLSALHSYARPPLPPRLGHAVSHYPPGSGTHSTEPMGIIDDSPRALPLTPEDRSAAYTLSTMGKHCIPAPAPPPAPSEPAAVSAQCSPSKKSLNTRTRHTSCPDPAKPRRPMNGFMLFAQKHRGEYSHMHPGKDNRAISVMLGDQWRKMKSEEKKLYSQEAKVRADEVKKVHPDCWKRKRSYSTSI